MPKKDGAAGSHVTRAGNRLQGYLSLRFLSWVESGRKAPFLHLNSSLNDGDLPCENHHQTTGLETVPSLVHASSGVKLASTLLCS